MSNNGHFLFERGDSAETQARVAVVGAGILGSTVALLLAESGFEVDLFEAEERLMGGASAVNEGKVHLGQVYALGDIGTLDLMLRGASSFAPVVERALGQPLRWDELTSDEFRYLVMPGSLATPDELTERYAVCNNRLEILFGGNGIEHYLGLQVDRVTDLEPVDIGGRLGFRSFERAVDPLRIGKLYTKAVLRNPAIRVHLSKAVLRIEHEGDRPVVVLPGERRLVRYKYLAAVNCTWHEQNRLHASAGFPSRPLNYRVKAAVRLRGGDQPESLTMVQGPFGDVVGHGEYTFVSWYPEARLWHEHSEIPSSEFRDALARCSIDEEVMQRQLAALSNVGVLPNWHSAEPIGGAVLGEGGLDIDAPTSPLHSRSRFGLRTRGRLLTPINFKWSTAPLAASRAARAVEAISSG